MSDTNYKSYDGPNVDVLEEYLDPIGAGWLPGSWQDTARFYKRYGCSFLNFTIISGGTEDAVDVSNHNLGNTFANFSVSGGDKYVLTLKGNSSNNLFRDWFIIKPGKWVDIQIGNWHDQDLDDAARGLCYDNVFYKISRADGKPVRYAYRFGCTQTFSAGSYKHLWWMSIGLTAYWWAKYLWLKCKSSPKT